MIKWFLKRFIYTRELELADRENKREIATLDKGLDLYKKIIEEYRNAEYEITKLTLKEAHELFSACVDYQRALFMLSAADPIQPRIIPIMEKYGITIERNTVSDDVAPEELQAIMEYFHEEAGKL